MVRTQISLDAAAYRDLKVEAQRQGISIAEFLRQAVASKLAATRVSGRPWMRYAGAIESGDRGASHSVDRVVYGRSRP